MKFLFLSILEVGRGGALEKIQLRILKEDSTMCIVLGTSSVFTAFWIILFFVYKTPSLFQHSGECGGLISRLLLVSWLWGQDSQIILVETAVDNTPSVISETGILD